MVSDSFLATSASNVVAFASDRNRKCHIICPCVMKSAWQLTSRPVTEGPEAPENGLWRCRGSWWAQSPRCPHICNVLMQKSTSLRLPSSEETAPLKSLSPPHSSETLDSPRPLSLSTGSGLTRSLRSNLLWYDYPNGSLIGNTWFWAFWTLDGKVLAIFLLAHELV